MRRPSRFCAFYMHNLDRLRVEEYREFAYMSTSKATIGNQIDANLRDSANLIHIPHHKIETILELLDAIQDSVPNLPIAMLRTTANRLSTFLNVPVDRLAIDDVVDVAPEFRNYLEERRYKHNAVRSYCGFLATLLRAAKELGWECRQPEIPDAWKEILCALAKCKNGVSGIVRYAIRQGKVPSELCDQDLNAWSQMALNQGRAYAYAHHLSTRFRRAISELGLADNFPHISRTSHKIRYGVPVRFFPARLRAEVEALLTWKQDPYAEGRPRRARVRAVTAENLKKCITRLYGFVTNVDKRKNVTTLAELVTNESVVSFVKWSLNHRKLKSAGLVSSLGLLCAAMRWNPAYKDHDLSWFRTLLSQIPPDPESERKERKSFKYLPYDAIADISRLIRGRREEVAKLGRKQLAFLVHDELLIFWLVTLVWRQRNIRECRIGHNLFKAGLPPLANIARPKWVDEMLRVNPHEQFWQFYFREDETKTGHEVRAILPHRLVSLLDEYLDQYRPLLFKASDPGNLFLNRAGGPLTDHEVTILVSNLTMRYKHRRVTPHLFRDIFAYRWLDHHPEDSLTLSKVLWHRDLKTTLRIYGGKFDESHGLRRVEEWFDNRIEEPADIVQETIESASELGHRLGEGHSLDYKLEYEQQRKVAKRLVHRVEQLEKQLSQRTLESASP
jgi:integrase